MATNTDEILSNILEEGKDLLKSLYASIDNKYVNLIQRNFQNVVVLSGEYAKAYIQGDEGRVNVKKKSIEHGIASIISVALTAVAELIGDARTIAYTKLSELLAYLSTQLIIRLNSSVANA